jgi:hypothetical protein
LRPGTRSARLANRPCRISNGDPISRIS